MENNLPSILGGMAQGFTDFGKGLFDMFGTGGASVLDLIESAKTGNVTNRRQDDFRKWLYQTDSTKDAAAKGLGTALNGVQTVADYIPGVNALTQTTLGNAAQGALGGLADELKTYGEDYDLGRAGQRAAISAAGAVASGGLADALKGSNNALLSSNTVRGLARGATGGAISGGGYAAIDGGDVLEAAKQGAGMGALIGGATGAFQDFAPRKSIYNAAMTDGQRQARIANIDDQLSKLDTSTPDGNARYNELMQARNRYNQTFYHGTPKNPTESGDTLGSGLYITSNKDRATGYANGGDVSSYDTSGLNIANLDDVIPENVAKVLRDNPELSDKLKTLTPTTETYDLAQRDAAYNRFKALKGEYPRDLIEVKKTNSGFDISYPGDVDYTKITGKDLFRKLNTPDAQDVFMRAGYDGVSKTALGGDTEMAIYRNAPQPLESILADADMAVNNPRYLTDENGNPRTFYHGSPNKNITEFDVNQAGKNTSSGEHALYFTDSPQVADDFSYERLPGDSMFIENKGAKGRVYPVNLEMNNPLDLDNLSDAQIRELWEYASPLGQLDGQEKFIRNLTDWRDNAHNAQLTKGYLDLDKLRDSQYDGFTARMYPNQENQAREYAVFDNSKVKMLEDVLANDDMAVNNQTKGLGGSPDGAQNYRTFATGDEAREYFGNSNPGYWDKAPGYDDIQEYTRNGYSRVNDMLRTGQDNYGYPDTDIMIDNIERGIDGYDLKDDIKVYRKSNADVYKNLKVGDTFTDNGFTSASVTPEIGGDFGKANIEIDVGKGKGVGAFIGDLSSGYGDEGEFLLQRGTKYKVVGKDGDKLKLEVVGNERKPLEQILANQDLSVNSAKIAPGQLGLFDDMPTQTPKTGTRQTSLFDQPDNPYLDYYGADIDATPLTPEAPANPYAPVDGQVTQAMRDRASEIIDNLALKKQIPDNELFNKIDPATLPKGQQKIGEFLDQAYAKGLTNVDIADMMRETVSSEFDKRLGKTPNKEKLISFIFGNADETAKKEMMDKELGLYIAPETVSEGTLSSMAKHKISSEIYGDNLSALTAGNRTLRGGYTGALDSVLSERLGIAPGNTYKKTGTYDTGGSYGRYQEYTFNPNKNNIMVRTALDNEDAVNTMAHERLHSFQTEAKKLYDRDRYSPEVKDAYDELAKDLKNAKAYRTGNEIKNRYGGNVAYWRHHDEQEARMLQQYLDAKGYTGSRHHNENQYLGLEFDDAKITPAFDKFFDKLRDLSKRGVALPALAALFGGGAYMASQENDKDKEVK